MRIERWPVFALMSVALMCLGASCDGGGRASQNALRAGEDSEQPAAAQAGGSEARVERIDNVDVSQLTDPERQLWVELINEQLSPCGDPVAVGPCAAARPLTCGACVTATRYLARLVTEGYERIEIEEHYGARFGRDTQKTFALDDTPVRGAPLAAVSIVEFSDFECPYCGAASPMLKEVLRAFDGKVSLAFKHYPLTSHPRAMPAALAAEAARMQGKFWEMHDLLFANQRRLQESDLIGYAQQLKLDVAQFRSDLTSEKLRSRIERDRLEGQQAGVEATPTLYINGRKYSESARNLAAYIREELEL